MYRRKWGVSNRRERWVMARLKLLTKKKVSGCVERVCILVAGNLYERDEQDIRHAPRIYNSWASSSTCPSRRPPTCSVRYHFERWLGRDRRVSRPSCHHLSSSVVVIPPTTNDSSFHLLSFTLNSNLRERIAKQDRHDPLWNDPVAFILLIDSWKTQVDFFLFISISISNREIFLSFFEGWNKLLCFVYLFLLWRSYLILVCCIIPTSRLGSRSSTSIGGDVTMPCNDVVLSSRPSMRPPGCCHPTS